MKQALLSGAMRAAVWLLAVSAAVPVLGAVPASDKLLPATTVAYLRVAHPADLDARLQRTQIGQFAADPSLKPFVDQVKENLSRRLGNLQENVGITIDDMRDVAGGELAWGLLARDKGRAAAVLLVDTTGHADKRDALVKKLDDYLIGRKAEKSTNEVAGVTITSYKVPPQKEGDKTRTAAYFVQNDLLCVTDHRGAATEMAQRLRGSMPDPIGEDEAYKAVRAKCRDGGESTPPDVQWFIKPFPMVDAMRTIRPRNSESEDRLKQLRDQGFDAVKGIGGQVHVAADEKRDFIHRTAIYAPPVPGAPTGKKYRLGMNIFVTPNSTQLLVDNWTPRTIARYTTLNIDLLNAFDNVGPLFDEMIAGYEGAFETAMKRFKEDPFGPQINFRDDIIANLGTRVCAMTDYTLPIDTDSERFMLAIDLKPGKMVALKVALGKYLEKDGYIEKDLDGHEIWEFQPEPEEDFDIGLSDGGLFAEDSIDKEADKERLLTRSAVCVTQTQLFIASDVEFLRLAFQQAAENESLAESYDYLAVAESLAKLAPPEQCSWSFTRTDEAIRPTYALLRENRLPESESFFARLLNELLTSPEDQKNQLLRKQKLDGSELPSFELARRYFGPSGRSIRSDKDGWLVTGVVLNKATN